MALSKKAFYFSIDAFLSAILLVAGLVLLSTMTVEETPSESTFYLSTDLLTAFSSITLGELNNTVASSLVEEGKADPNNTVLEQLGEFWALNITSEAANLTESLIQGLIPERAGLTVGFQEDLFYEENASNANVLINARRMVTGVKKGAPLTGTSASAYLERIREKQSSSYLYFGGFVGQGNITGFVNLPSDVNASQGKVLSIYLQLQSASGFSIYFNDQFCASLNATPNSTLAWDLSSCNASLKPGTNQVYLSFNDLNNAFISGGFLRVTYLSSQPSIEGLLNGTKKYFLPGIEGVVNLYDSFFVPGILKDLSVYLHYFANHSSANNTFYLTIGNSTVYTDLNSTTEQFIYLSGSNLSASINFSSLNLTVPIRVGFENLTYVTSYKGIADVVIVTDVSGSMDWMMSTDYFAGTPRNCDDPSFNSSDTSRLSVAKCLDKTFALNVLNITGNKVGLVSYESSTRSGETVALTQNFTVLNQTIGTAVPETGYYASGATCICCGINSASDLISASLSVQTLVSKASFWLYYPLSKLNDSNLSQPPDDQAGNAWTEQDYNDSDWSTGQAVLGSNEDGQGPSIATDVGSLLRNNSYYPDLWELAQDSSTVYVDFTSGLNQTGNTFGWTNGSGDDGWDTSFGYFNTGGTDVYINTDPNEDGNQDDNKVANNGRIEIFIGNSWDDDSPSKDEIPDSGAVGVELYVSQDAYNTLRSNGSATLHFEWTLDPTYLDPGEEGWIKALFGRMSGDKAPSANYSNYLGSNLDENGTISDPSPEVFWCEDTGSSAPDPSHACPNPGSGVFNGNLSKLITSPGWYYLVIGAKATENPGDNTWDEDWRFYIDNVYIEIANSTDTYYFRKHFTISNKSAARKGIINLLADDSATVYVNGNLVHSPSGVDSAKYWNERGINVKEEYLKEGDNVVAVMLTNKQGAAKFDLELRVLNDTRNKAILLMTDGQANRQCARQGTGSSTGDAVQAACDAKEQYGITVYSVGFSDAADEAALQSIAECGEGLYKKSNNVQELEEFYKDVASNIVEVSRQSQTVILSKGYAPSTLYPDSYILVNYTPLLPTPSQNEVSVTLQSGQFNTCTPVVSIPAGIRVLEAMITSYSAEHWTDLVVVNNKTAFNLSRYNKDYSKLGDPFSVYVDPTILAAGANYIRVKTGDNPYNDTGCSANNTLIYSAAINLSTPRLPVLEKAEGCNWVVELESGIYKNFSVPSSYSGGKNCSYTNATISYDEEDAYDSATHALLDQLDFDDDGRILIDFSQEDLEIQVLTVSQVPYMWGPSLLEVNAWS